MYNQSHLDAYAAALIADYKGWVEQGGSVYIKEDYIVSFEEGKKYIRVVRTNLAQRGVVAFIEITSGDIYKAASWKTPAKNKPRGNVLNLTPNVVCWTGAR